MISDQLKDASLNADSSECFSFYVTDFTWTSVPLLFVLTVPLLLLFVLGFSVM